MNYDHRAVRAAYPNAVTILDGKGVFDASRNPITIDNAKVEAEANKVKYKTNRAKDYLGIEDQLDQLYWDKKNGTNKWVEAIDKVKSDNPKP